MISIYNFLVMEKKIQIGIWLVKRTSTQYIGTAVKKMLLQTNSQEKGKIFLFDSRYSIVQRNMIFQQKYRCALPCLEQETYKEITKYEINNKSVHPLYSSSFVFYYLCTHAYCIIINCSLFPSFFSYLTLYDAFSCFYIQ